MTGAEHYDPETLAEFAEGRLAGARRDAVVAHLDVCDDCMNDVALVLPAAQPEVERGRFRRSSWLLAIAAAVTIAFALPVLWKALNPRSPVAQLVAVTSGSARPVEPRLTGGFEWAEYRGPMRASSGMPPTAQLKLHGAAATLIERAESDRGAEAQHAAGVAMVLIDKPVDAVGRLRSAANAKPDDARTWSDLAAAEYAAAMAGETSRLSAALAAADKAIGLDSHLPEPLFNRALILERLGVTSEARRAWQRYLELDPASAWAAEARERLAQLPISTSSSRFKRDQPLLETAALAGDVNAARTLVEAHPERFRRFGEAEYLGRWAEASQRGDAADAARWLTIARLIGGALSQLSGESLLRDAVAAIDRASLSDRSTIADAHVAYRRGRIAYSRRDTAAGERELRRAAVLFEAAGDPMSLMARYYAAGARLARNHAGARAELANLRAEADEHPSYLALGAQVRWELARSISFTDDAVAQVAALAEAADLFRRGGERAAEASVEAMLATALSFLGRADDAWTARTRALRALSEESQADLLDAAVVNAATAELTAGHHEGALALTCVAEALQRAGADPVLIIETLLRRAMLEVVTAGDLAATAALRRADDVASGLADPEMRAWQRADIDIARGAQLLPHDPRAATAALTRGIDFHRSRERFAALPEPLLLRARAALRLGDPAAAERDLEGGIAAVERRPVRMGRGVLGTGVLDAGNALFAEAIRFHLDRGELAGAFEYAERSRGARPVAIEELKRRLGDSGTAVLELVTLPDEVVTLAVSRHDVVVGRRRRATGEWASLSDSSLGGDERAAALLYDDLVRPVDRIVQRATSLIVIPDAAVAGVPFGALYDSVSRRHLVEQLPVALASSASALQVAARRSPNALAAIGLPTAGAAALPEQERELADIAALYRNSATLSGVQATWPAFGRAASSADVVHLAGHTDTRLGESGPALVFSRDTTGTPERVTWKSIVSAPVPHAQVVVLAACETLRPPQSGAGSRDVRALSLGAAFAAGGADVVGTLLPIADRDARALFRSLHQQLAEGATAAEAVRAVQLHSIRDEISGGTTRAWRGLAVMSTHITSIRRGDHNG